MNAMQQTERVRSLLMQLCGVSNGILQSAYDIMWGQHDYRWEAAGRIVGFRMSGIDHGTLARVAQKWKQTGQQVEADEALPEGCIAGWISEEEPAEV